MIECGVSSSAIVGDFNPFKENALPEVERKQGDAKNGLGLQGFEK